jgi:hypothetical protein
MSWRQNDTKLLASLWSVSVFVMLSLTMLSVIRLNDIKLNVTAVTICNS